MNYLIIDNYDSFTYNLYQDLAKVVRRIDKGGTIDVVRNDEYTLDQIRAKKYDRIIISPGPGSPEDPAYFGICGEVITKLGVSTPILGVCLGMQGIAYCFGGKIVPAKVPMHGRTSRITHDGKGVFADLPNGLEVMRYHSLIVDKDSLSAELIVTSTDEDGGEIMGIRHRNYPIQGVQFHPESFASEGGEKLIENFVRGVE